MLDEVSSTPTFCRSSRHVPSGPTRRRRDRGLCSTFTGLCHRGNAVQDPWGRKHSAPHGRERGDGAHYQLAGVKSPCTLLSWRAWNPLVTPGKRGESRLPTHSLCWPGWWGAHFSALSGWRFSALLCRPSPPPLARERAGFVGVLCHIQVTGFFGSGSGIYEIKTNLRELSAACFRASPASLPCPTFTFVLQITSRVFSCTLAGRIEKNAPIQKVKVWFVCFFKNSRCQGSDSLGSFT